MTRDRSDVYFAQFDMGGEETSIPIPPRQSSEGGSSDSGASSSGNKSSTDKVSSGEDASSSASDLGSNEVIIKHDLFDSNDVFAVDVKPERKLSLEQRFVAYGRQHEDRVGEEVAFVPFKSYWPTYESMTNSQLGWYFYWRGEVRAERYPNTDLSYIFLYIYELINGIGWVQPMHGYELLLRIWEAYQKRYPKLNAYLPEWVTDYKVVHRLEVPFQHIVDRTPRGLGGLLLEMELMSAFRQDPIQISWRSLLKLSDYDIAKSKFYQQDGKDMLEHYAPKVLALVDGYMAKTSGKRLMEKYRPVTRNRKKFLFRSTVYDETLYGDLTDIDIMEMTSCTPLRKFITELLRGVENELREQMDFRGRLRNIKLEPELASLVNKYIVREYAAMEAEKNRVIVEIDSSKLKQLQQDSDQVRELLTFEEEANTKPTDNPLATAYTKPATEQLELSFDLVSVGESLPIIASEEPTLFSNHDETMERFDPSDEGIQESASEEKDEVRTASMDDSVLSPEWQTLGESLQPMHLEALQLLIQGKTVSELAGIAMQYGTMPDLLVDELNSLAMDTIGDLLVDGDVLMEEYETQCRILLDYYQ